jgi:L-seryl-tRNA(Ser) seleniumtransferase
MGDPRRIPSIDEIRRRPTIQALEARFGARATIDALRAAASRVRTERGPEQSEADDAKGSTARRIEMIAEDHLARLFRPSLATVINATGVVIHTNLGRAPLSRAAIDRIAEVARGYCSLEYDVEDGGRGRRDVHAETMLRFVTGAEAAVVVNNNAAATLLVLAALAKGREVVVSRGELVEIGGSFRIPDVMSKSHATLREVGTTNRTRVADYERAISDRTRLLLRVHRSNFEITGFTEQPSLEELVELGRRRNIPVLEDLGSGALFDLRSVGISGEPGVLDSLRAGVDVVTYSGDKLLGAPQAGLISGRADLVARMRSNSLFRALRVDKLTYAALEATLLAYVKRDHDQIPVVHMMRRSKEEISARAEQVLATLTPAKLKAELLDGESVIGGGAAPSASLPTRLIALTHRELSADALLARLRSSDPPVIARVEEGRVLLDLRTVFPGQESTLVAVLQSLG